MTHHRQWQIWVLLRGGGGADNYKECREFQGSAKFTNYLNKL